LTYSFSAFLDSSLYSSLHVNETILSNPDSLRLAANDLIASTDISGARKILSYGVSRFPNDPKLRNNLGQLYASSGNLELARQELVKSVSIEPSLAVAWSALIRIALLEHDSSEVIRHIEAAAASGIPEEILAPFRVIVLNVLKMYSLAATTAGNIMATCEIGDELMSEYLVSLSHTNQAELGIQEACRFLQNNPNSIDVKLQLALLLQQVGKPEQGLSTIDSIAAPLPLHSLNIAQAKVTMFEDLGIYDKAIEAASFCFNRQHDLTRNAHLLFSLNASIGNWASAWKYHPYRWIAVGRNDYADPSTLPIWTVEDHDARVYVYAEQGVGDQVLAYKILALFSLAKPSTNLFVFEVDSKLSSILPTTAAILVVPTKKRALNAGSSYTHHISMYSLVQEILSSTNWVDLFSDLAIHQAITESVRLHISSLSARLYLQEIRPHQSHLGVCWRSNNPLVGIDQSLSLADLLNGLQSTDIGSALSLQYLPTSYEQQLIISSQYNLQLPEADLYSDLLASAKLTMSVSNLLTVSTFTAHLAGLLGVNSHMLISPGRPKAWYWNLIDRCSCSLVYPSIRIYQKNRRTDSYLPLISQALDSLEG